jgi:tetratricopeptide (TPR) repeat protein
MNLHRLEAMVRDGDMSKNAASYLASCRGECEYLDFKSSLKLTDDYELACFGRDILAMKNIGGGYLVIGVDDKTWSVRGVPPDMALDTKLVRDAARKATGVTLEIDVVFHDIADGLGAMKRVGIILVRGNRRRNQRRRPSIVQHDFRPQEKWGLRVGEIWVRSGDSTKRVTTEAELVSLIDDIDDRVEDSEANSSFSLDPFALSEGLYRLLDRGFQHFVGREQLREEVMKAVTSDPRIWIVNVHGPGGVGKSALVNWVTYEFYERREFESILHLSAKDTQLSKDGITPLSRSLYSLENLLDHILLMFEEPRDGTTEAKWDQALEILTAWKVLLVLDNMETVQDGRILNFIRSIPPTSSSKVLLTSRQKSGGWELPVEVTELVEPEVAEFMAAKLREEGISLPLDSETIARVTAVTGGLPLAIQWVVGQIHLQGDLKRVLKEVRSANSPILEFSFRNIWHLLSQDARVILATLPILEDSASFQLLQIVTLLPGDRIDQALSELANVTLVRRIVNPQDGTITYAALPITLSFATNQLRLMGNHEQECRRRYDEFTQQTSLREAELGNFQSTISQFGLTTRNEKTAAILLKRAYAELSSDRIEAAAALCDQALSLAPNHAYVLANAARLELGNGRIGRAVELAAEACSRASRPTQAFAYHALADCQEKAGNRVAQIEALRRALDAKPDVIVQHKLGVALSRHGIKHESIQIFTDIIASEQQSNAPRRALLYALRSRAKSYSQLGMGAEAAADEAAIEAILAVHPHLR